MSMHSKHVAWLGVALAGAAERGAARGCPGAPLRPLFMDRDFTAHGDASGRVRLLDLPPNDSMGYVISAEGLDMQLRAIGSGPPTRSGEAALHSGETTTVEVELEAVPEGS
jgi:hypothetical protein